jgi:hypothetical protein
MHCKSEQHGAGPGIGVEVVTGEEFLSRSRGKAKAGQSMGEMAINRSRNAMRLLHDVLDHLTDRDNIKVFIHLCTAESAVST